MSDAATEAAGAGATAAPTILVVYLASMRERMGRSDERVQLPASVATVGALASLIADRGVREREAFGDRRAVRAAVNHRFAREHDAIKAGDEVAFFPPVTGG